ncbi:hypothetical protein HY78_15030 [Rhizorhabdus wittichii DC-6]|nr:hypothetical protein HY78_15030 [Rhizorhabdus wittichii DC-6]
MTAPVDDRPVPEIRLGGMLFSLAQPDPGWERHFHRWYERDHFYAGCMAGAGFFAGRRWLATRAMRAERFPATTPVADDIRDGSFLVTYWVLGERLDETITWSVEQVLRLHRQGRMEAPRRNISTGYYRYAGGAFRDADGVPAELALDHGYPGAMAIMVDAAEEGDTVAGWLRDDVLPGLIAGTAVPMALCFRPVPLPDNAPGNVARPDPAYFRQRVMVLAFLDTPPPADWDAVPRAVDAALQASGRGALVFAGPFIPTVPGTDMHVDQL